MELYPSCGLLDGLYCPGRELICHKPQVLVFLAEVAQIGAEDILIHPLFGLEGVDSVEPAVDDD